jgi:hypothetical protein
VHGDVTNVVGVVTFVGAVGIRNGGRGLLTSSGGASMSIMRVIGGSTALLPSGGRFLLCSLGFLEGGVARGLGLASVCFLLSCGNGGGISGVLVVGGVGSGRDSPCHP